jgi:hypothetical protein
MERKNLSKALRGKMERGGGGGELTNSKKK